MCVYVCIILMPITLLSDFAENVELFSHKIAVAVKMELRRNKGGRGARQLPSYPLEGWLGEVS